MTENVGFAGQIGPEHLAQVVEKALNRLSIIVQILRVVQNSQPVHRLKKLLVTLVSTTFISLW